MPHVLQPILSGVSEELFGFSEVGSGPEEDAQMEELVADRRITEAVRWVRSACSVSPTDDLRPLPGRRHPLRTVVAVRLTTDRLLESESVDP